MEIIKRNDTEYKIYPVSEAEDLGIVYTYWKEASAGDWCISDDGWVSECRSSKTYNNKINIGLPFGQYWDNQKALYEERRGTGRFKNKSWQEYEVRSSRGRRLILEAARQLLSDGKLDYNKLGLVYRKDQAAPIQTVRRILKQKVFMDAIEKKVEEKLAEKGIDVNYVLELFKTASELALKSEDSDAVLRVAKELKIMLGMEPKKRSYIEQIESSNIQYLEDNIAKEEEKLKLSKIVNE